MAQAGLGDVGARRVRRRDRRARRCSAWSPGSSCSAASSRRSCWPGSPASAPVATYRRRRARRRDQARDAWPRLIDEIRILTGRAGRSVPQALFEVGRAAPVELRPAFAAAHREWMLSTDFARTLDVLKRRWPTPPPTPPARPCSSPTSSAAPISTAGSRRWPTTAARTPRAARTPWPSRPACGSPGGSCSSCRWAWRWSGLSIGNGRVGLPDAARPGHRRGGARAHGAAAGCGPGGSCACPTSSGCSQ